MRERLLARAMLALYLVLGLPSVAGAEESQIAIGFSNLVVRLETKSDIGFAKEEYRVLILEHLRKSGFNAVGAESLVFGDDKTGKADLLLGGTVTEVTCKRKVGVKGGCRVSVEWEVLDVALDQVIYSVNTKFAVTGLKQEEIPEYVPKQMLLGALSRLEYRPAFKKLFVKSSSSKTEHPKAQFKQCPTVPVKMPGGAEQALDATVVVEMGKGFGSGYFISRDGLLVTAAHVVRKHTEVTVKTRTGAKMTATVVRRNNDADVALLRVNESAPQCLRMSKRTPKIGWELYALGAPARKALSFTLTRGIVSGMRRFDEHEFMQTDAPINPGNSGGPMVDESGYASAVVSWKIVGGSVEGIGFGVPTPVAMEALGISPGSTTSPQLLKETALERKVKVIKDQPDAVPELDPEGARKRELAEKRAMTKRARARKMKELTPGFVRTMKWGGVALAIAGVTGVVASYKSYEPATVTKSNYETLVLVNDLSWGAVGLGGALVVTGIILTPSLPDDGSVANGGGLQLQVAPTRVTLGGSF